MKPICRVCGNSYVGTSVFGTYVCNSCDTRLEAEVARLTTERNDAQTNGVTTANYWMDRAEKAEAERDALLGVNQCYICGGPATSHWCDLHRPSLLCRAQTKGTT